MRYRVKALAGIGFGKVLLKVLQEKARAICLSTQAQVFPNRNEVRVDR